jgi:predicted DNA-binding transcriptional regulator YafY
MRRAERLFQIVQWIRGRRLTQAEWLATRLEVSARTIYRDVAELQLQGVPIVGEAGVGYRMRAGFDLPPLMFTTAEAKALVASVRLAQPRLDTVLAREADSALAKILSVLPAAARAAAESMAVYAPVGSIDEATRQRLTTLREATESHQVLHIDYVDVKGEESQRRVRPLGVFHWDAVWTLAAWCEWRVGFRSFRVDRIGEIVATGDTFRDEPGKTLADLLRSLNRSLPGAP